MNPRPTNTPADTSADRATFTRMEHSTQDDWRKIGAEYMPFARQLPDRLIAHLKVLEGDYGGFPIDRYTYSSSRPARNALVAVCSECV